jgi:hypothetical protein
VDAWLLVAIIAIIAPVAVIYALAKSASLKGAEPRPGGARRVESLVTEVIADDRPEEEREFPDAGPGGNRPDPDGGLH